jgi:hypothetical protein
MPEDRTQDYAIYSHLLKSGPIEWRNVSRKQWLIEDTTDAIPLDLVCRPASEIDCATRLINGQLVDRPSSARKVVFGNLPVALQPRELNLLVGCSKGLLRGAL